MAKVLDIGADQAESRNIAKQQRDEDRTGLLDRPYIGLVLEAALIALLFWAV